MNASKKFETPAKPRAVYLMEDMTPKRVGKVIQRLLKLDQKSDDPIRMFIYCEGGAFEEGNYLRNILALYLRSPVITIGIGLVQSAAAVILNCGAIRLAFPKTKFLFHEVRWEITDSEVGNDYAASHLKKTAKEYDRDTETLLKDVTKRLKTHLNPCTMTRKEIFERINKAKEDDKKEYAIQSRTAYELGFIDGIIKNVGGIRRYERLLLGSKKRGKS